MTEPNEKNDETGDQAFFGPETPEEESEFWLGDLVDAVAACMTADSPTGPLGCRYVEEGGFWHVILYPTPVELIGGAEDGEIVAPGFSLDLEALRALFDRVDTFDWRSLGFPSDGPEVSIEGRFQGCESYLQVLAYAPDDEEPGMKLDTVRRGH